MKLVVFYLILIYHITLVFSYDFSHQYLLQKEISFSPCSPVSSIEGAAQGELIFSGSDLSTTSISEIMIVGWFMLRGYNLVEYRLITIHENNGLNVIVSLRYSLPSQTLIYDFKSNLNNYMSIPLMAKNKWYFLKLQVILGSSNSSQDTINILMYSLGEAQQSTSSSYSSIPPTVFSRSSMSLSVGKYFISQVQPSCALVKEVTLFLDPQPWMDVTVSFYHQKEQETTYLIWSIDFFYTKTNLKNLILLGQQTSIVYEPWIDSLDLSKIAVGAAFQKIQPSHDDSKGFMIYLEFMAPVETKTGYIYLITVVQTIFSFNVGIFSNGLLGIGKNPPYAFYPLFTITQGTWYQVLFIMNLVASIPTFQLIAKDGSQIYQISQSISGYNPLENDNMAFSGGDNFYIDNYRYYQGAFTAQSSSCYIQVASSKQSDCLICQVGYILSYKDGMKCVLATSGPSTQKPGIVLDWNRAQCPPLRVYSYPDITDCVCLNQFYLDNSSNSCQMCPTYCTGCSDSTTCLNLDSNRDLTGECKLGYYDQGFQCVSSFYKIPFRQNLLKNIPPLNQYLEKVYQIHKNTLNYNYDSSSFFVSFHLIPLTISSVDYQQIVAYVRDGITDRFLISIQFSQSQQTYKACFYHLSIELFCFPFNSVSAWVGLWTDFNKVTTLVGTYGDVLYMEFNSLVGLVPFVDPIVCVGTCIEINHSTLNLFSQFTGTAESILSIIDIPYQSFDQRFNDFLDLQGRQAILYYEFSSISIITISGSIIAMNRITDISINSSSSQTMLFALSQADPLKGFYQNYMNGSLSSPILFDHEFSFSMNIFIQLFSPFQEFFSYNMNGWLIHFYISFSNENNRYGITVCYDNNCKSVNNCPAGGNFFFFGIVQRILDEGSLDVSYFEYDIVCNEQRGRIQFYLPYPTLISAKTSVKTSSIANQLYINNIRLFQGSDFYFDYTATDNCFMYYDLKNMKCLRSKAGYAMYQGQVVAPEDCINFSTSTQAVIFNRFTQECIQINTIIPGCMYYSDDLTMCLKCIDPIIIPPDCNTCPKGYFKVDERSLCKKCHAKCSECQSQYDNCTGCISENSSPPYCECSLKNQFRDSLFKCTNCSPQCGSCTDTADACTSCSEGRLYPPQCTCDSSLYSLSLSTVSSCKLLVCAPQCETCEFSPTNCTKCSTFRVNPPNCTDKTLPCYSGYFYSSHQDLCVQCDSSCKECAKDKFNCIECHNSSFLVNQGCVCSDMTTVVEYTSGNLICSTSMGVQLLSQMKNSKLQLIFQFSETLDNIDFYDTSIDFLIDIHINQIPQETFSIQNQDIEDNKLILTIVFTESISGTTGTAQFLQTQYFKNTPSQVSLSISYLSIPLSFKVPMILSTSDYSPNETLQSIADSLNSSDSIFLDFFRQFQVIFYFLNTLQPCVAFIMLNTQFPPNLYQFLQVTGLMVFPKVLSSAEEATQLPISITFLGTELSTANNNEISPNSSKIFNKLGFSNTMLVNIPITLIQNFLCVIILFSISIVNTASLQFYPSSKIQKIWQMLLKKINSNSEVSLLLVITSIFNQFLNLSSHQYLNRLSFYLAMIYLVLLVFFIIYNFRNLHRKRVVLKGQDIQQNGFLVQVEKLKFQQFPVQTRRFYFFSILKKYSLSITLVFLESVPAAVCAINFIILAFSMLWTAWKRPYIALISNIAKILGDLCQCTIWMIIWFGIIPIENDLKNAAIIPRSTATEFLAYGTAVLFLLAVFNLVYFLEFFWIQIILKIQKYIKNYKDKKVAMKKEALINKDAQLQFDSCKFIDIHNDQPKKE